MDSSNSSGGHKMGFLTKLFIRSGLAKNQKQANVYMIVVFLICVSLTAYIDITTFAPNLLQFGQEQQGASFPNNELQQRIQDDRVNAEAVNNR